MHHSFRFTGIPFSFPCFPFFFFFLVWSVIFNMESSMGYLVFVFFHVLLSLLEWEKLPMIALSLNEIKTKKSEMPKVFEPFWMDFNLLFFFFLSDFGRRVFLYSIGLSVYGFQLYEKMFVLLMLVPPHWGF